MRTSVQGGELVSEVKRGRKRGIALILVGMVLGAALIAPAGAHIGSVKHTWKKHFLPLAKKAFYTKKQTVTTKQANQRYVPVLLTANGYESGTETCKSETYTPSRPKIAIVHADVATAGGSTAGTMYVRGVYTTDGGTTWVEPTFYSGQDHYETGVQGDASHIYPLELSPGQTYQFAARMKSGPAGDYICNLLVEIHDRSAANELGPAPFSTARAGEAGDGQVGQ